MLTCIACSKQLGGSLHEQPDNDGAGTPSTRQAIKALTAQIKEMALRASGAYRQCKPCSGAGAGEGGRGYEESEATGSGSERYVCGYRRAGESSASTPRVFVVSGDATPSMSGRTEAAASVFMEEDEDDGPREWVAQVEPGVLITFVSVPRGGNDLKRIRFSREMFNKWQAQRWWAENYDRVMELYNVQRFNRQAVPLATPPRSEDEVKTENIIAPHPLLPSSISPNSQILLDSQSSKIESAEDSPVTPPLSKERLPRNFQRPMGGAMGYSSSDSLEHHSSHTQRHHNRHYYDSGGLTSTPKLSSISGAKTETSSMDASVRTSSSPEDADRSGELSVSFSNASDQETEWVEQDEPGVYITIRALPGGIRELRRVRFSRERFGEMHARLWWEENRARIREQYL